MTRRMRLVERRAVVRRLPQADVAALADDWSHVIEVVPTHRRGWYRLTARGWVGTFTTPSRTWELAPKLGWPAAERLLDDGRQIGSSSDLAIDLRSAMATRLSKFMVARLSAGLVRGYIDRTEQSALVRGRIDFAALVRLPFGGLTQVVDVLSADQPWNGWPVTVAGRLLAGPLTTIARESLQVAVDGYGQFNAYPEPAAKLLTDARLIGYRPLLDWCRLVEATLAGSGFLMNLERLFEAYISRLLAEPVGERTVVPQRMVQVSGPAGIPGVELRPDMTVLDPDGRPSAVCDIKWKPLPRTGPRPDDLHQVLGYAAVLGVRTAVLLYPGRRFATRRYTTPSGVTMTVATCRLLGSSAQIMRAEKSVRRLVQGV